MLYFAYTLFFSFVSQHGVQRMQVLRIVLLFYKKRVLRIIDKQGFGTYSALIFYKYRILKFENIYLS